MAQSKWRIKMKTEHRCTICGQADERTINGKVYCTFCAEKNKKRRHKYYELKNHKEKTVPMAKIYETVRLANAEGLTYGKYVAKHKDDKS